MELHCTNETWKISAQKAGSTSAGRPTTSSMSTEGAMPYFLKGNITTTRVDEKTRNAGGATRAFSRRCTRLIKEQRARFYIVRRCVVMLICWNDYP